MKGDDMTDPTRDEFPALWANPISRRRLLRVAGLGAGAVAVAAVLPGCTSAAPGGEAAATGDLSAAFANTFLDLDPTTGSQVGTIAINDFVYEGLYRLDPFPPRTEITPELAAALPEELTPTSYRIRLREGVTFHDGTPLTAEDVAFTIQRIKDPATKSLFARFFEVITEVKATGELEVELTLAAPTTLLVQRLMLVKGMSKAAITGSPDALKLKPVGTGPYRIGTAVSGQRVELTRFDGYTGPREVNYDNVRVNVVADANARVSGLRTGQTKIIEDVPASGFASLTDGDGVTAEGVQGEHLTGLMFHCGKPPFDDVRVRQAVLYAIDRDSITDTSFFGKASPVWGSVIQESSPDHVAPDTTYSYDPERAKALLAEAGLGGGGIRIDLIAGTLDYLASQTPIIEENLRAVGFEPNVIPGELESLYSRVTAGDYNVFLMKGDTSAVGPTDAEFALRWIYYGDFPRSFLYWDGAPLAQVEKLLDEALGAADEATRTRLLGQVQNLVQNEVPIGRLHRTEQLTGWSRNLQGFRPSPTAGFVLDGVRG